MQEEVNPTVRFKNIFATYMKLIRFGRSVYYHCQHVGEGRQGSGLTTDE